MLNKYGFFPLVQMIEDGLIRGNGYKATNMPMDVSETEKEYNVVLDIPGVSKEDISIEYKDKYLKVSVESKDSKESSNENKFWLIERRYDRKERVIQFGKNIDNENIVAKYENGVLSLNLPKKEIEEKTKITIS